jgi:disulfide bond formation protein DsbB
MTPLRSAYLLAFLIPAALLGGALFSQYVFGLYPCEMCMWQRWPHLAAILLAIPALMFQRKSWSRLLLALAATAIMISGLIGAFHAGVEYGWWEGITTCATSIGESDNMLDSIMSAPLVRCDVSPWDLFGISLAGFNFLFSCGGALLVLWLMKKNRAGI